jgi:hypothetical protein
MNKDNLALVSSSRGQHLYRSGLECARDIGVVNKSGQVRPGAKGKIRGLVAEAVAKNWSDEEFNERVMALLVVVLEREPGSLAEFGASDGEAWISKADKSVQDRLGNLKHYLNDIDAIEDHFTTQENDLHPSHRRLPAFMFGENCQPQQFWDKFGFAGSQPTDEYVIEFVCGAMDWLDRSADAQT